jgi:NAD(P)-dependent dehydrogenase (short-subunit alcohol dehydrogenase family)
MTIKLKKTVVITGVSSGIGFHAAQHLLDRDYQVFGSVRKVADGESLRAKFGKNFTPLLFDVTDVDAIAEAVKVVESRLGDDNLAALVNNAGISPIGPMLHVSLDEVRHTIEVNAIGMLAVTQAFAPLLGTKAGARGNPGRVVNITSVNGAVAVPMMGGYNASKFAAEAINDTLRRELSIYGIHVSAIKPGQVETEIQSKIDFDDLETRYGKTRYWAAFTGLRDGFAAGKNIPLVDVSKKILHAIESPRPKADYPMHIMLRLNWLLPTKIMDNILVKFSGVDRCK